MVSLDPAAGQTYMYGSRHTKASCGIKVHPELPRLLMLRTII